MARGYQAVIFDLDGTLLNTLEDLQTAVNHTMSVLNCPARSLAEVKSFIGDGVKELLKRSLPTSRRKEDDLAQAYTLFRAYYALHNADKTLPYPGMVALINVLKQNGVRVAVVTNKVHFAAQTLCDRFFGKDAFTCVIGAKEGLAPKPSPVGVYKALAAMGVEAKNAVYVGDSDVDYQTAKNAGTDCVLVEWGFREKAFLRALCPNITVSSAQDLLQFLLGE